MRYRLRTLLILLVILPPLLWIGWTKYEAWRGAEERRVQAREFARRRALEQQAAMQASLAAQRATRAAQQAKYAAETAKREAQRVALEAETVARRAQRQERVRKQVRELLADMPLEGSLPGGGAVPAESQATVPKEPRE
jgi:hypothetical protein